jgi:hypothetical protein
MILHVRTAMRGLAITAVLWCVMVIAAQWHGALWPHPTVNPPTCFIGTTFAPDSCQLVSRDVAWQNFLLIGLIVEFLWLKSWMMASMTRRWDWLGSSLIAANVVFSIVYVYAMAVTLFPAWAMSRVPLTSIRVLLVLTLLWGLIQLLRVDDPDDDPPFTDGNDRRSVVRREADRIRNARLEQLEQQMKGNTD